MHYSVDPRRKAEGYLMMAANSAAHRAQYLELAQRWLERAYAAEQAERLART